MFGGGSNKLYNIKGFPGFFGGRGGFGEDDGDQVSEEKDVDTNEYY